MAIKLPQGFQIQGTSPIDTRVVMTKAEMAAAKKAQMPTNYVCICKDDGKLYIYNQNNEALADIGRFRLYEDIIDIPGAIQKAMSTEAGKAQMESAIAATLPGAIDTAMQTEGKAEEICDAMFNTEHFQTTVDNKIDLAISVIQAIDGN